MFGRRAGGRAFMSEVFFVRSKLLKCFLKSLRHGKINYTNEPSKAVNRS